MRTKRSGPNDPLDAEIARGIKDALYNCLTNIESGGSFAASGVFSEAPLPDLLLQGFGPVPLPLARRDADAICRRRTEGDIGSAPRVENSVGRWFWKPLLVYGNTKAENFTIRNPAWDIFVQGIASRAAEGLGIKPDAGVVKAKIDKARLWAIGADIRPHKDILKVPGGFGKLLICLPAAHEGGSLRTTYRGEVKDFLTETSCRRGYTYVAWYADVTFECKPLRSGYRLMLEYDLVLPVPVKLPSLVHVYNEKDNFRRLLTTWNDGVEKESATQMSNFPTLLAYVCDFHYTSQPLSFNALRGKDRLRAAYLEELCSRFNMGVYIANAERVHSGFCDYHYGEDDHHHLIGIDDDDSITLIEVVDFGGEIIAGGIPIDKGNFFQSEPLDEEVDDEDFDPDHGAVTHYYWATALVLIPSIARDEWLPQESKGDRSNKRKRSLEVIDLE